MYLQARIVSQAHHYLMSGINLPMLESNLIMSLVHFYSPFLVRYVSYRLMNSVVSLVNLFSTSGRNTYSLDAEASQSSSILFLARITHSRSLLQLASHNQHSSSSQMSTYLLLTTNRSATSISSHQSSTERKQTLIPSVILCDPDLLIGKAIALAERSVTK